MIIHKIWKKIRLSLQKLFLPVANLSNIFAGLFYTFISPAFHIEHRSVIAGKRKYNKELSENGSSNALLRRNIHRLEKGLIMRPRKAVFAKSYIKETVSVFAVALKNSTVDDQKRGELKWANDVLLHYFAIVKHEGIIEEAYEQFNRLSVEENEPFFIPYKRSIIEKSVSYQDFLQLSINRRSVRWYINKTVPREIIEKAITVASLSPSACNRQPFFFHVFDEKEKIQKVAGLPMGTKGFRENLPGLILISGKLSAYFDERDRHVIYIDASLAAMSLIYALETMGVSSCVINWPEIPRLEKEMKKLLQLDDDERVILLISYGYPDPEGLVPYSHKKIKDQLRKYY